MTSEDSSNDKSCQAEPAARPTGTPLPNLPPSHARYKICCGEKRDRWDYVKLVAELFGLFVLCVYATYTIKIYCANQKAADAAQKTFYEIQKQTTLLTQQVKGTQEAIVNFGISVESDGLSVSIVNQGHVIANNVTAHVTLTRKTLPDETQIGEPSSYPIEPFPLRPGSFDKTYDIPGFSKKEWDAIKDIKETVSIEYSYSYENGFGDTYSYSKPCESLLFLNYVVSSGIVVANSKGMFPCGDFNSKMREALKSRQEARSEARKQPAH